MLRSTIAWINILALVSVLITAVSPRAINASSLFSVQQSGADRTQAPQENLSIYLPIVLKFSPSPPTIFGVETNIIGSSAVLEKASAANTYWMRSFVISWKAIEPTRQSPPIYHWEYVNGQALASAYSKGLKVIATIKYTPDWAQKYPGVSCGPIAQNRFSAFAEFLQALVTIYGSGPYNVKYWELGNEPDVDHRIPGFPPDSHFGCWGEETDDYYGGGYYAEMLKVAYPAIKAVDPLAKVLIGGLLLNCDPTNPPPGESCKPAKFLEGILRNSGENYFDIISFHGYPPYVEYKPPGYQYTTYMYYDENHPYWAHNGGVVLGKANFIKEVMATYGVSKPIIPSEGALLCPEQNSGCNPAGNSFYQAQADYVVWLYIRNWAAGFLGTTWYTLEGPGWRNAGLLDGSLNPRPAYYAFSFITQELANTQYQGPITLYPKLRGYQFGDGRRRIWVLWAPDEQPYTISLPAGVSKVLNKYGVQITPQAGQITVKSPVYIEFNP